MEMEGRKWEELNMDILVNVFGRVGMESLLLDVPFVCKSWYKASREPRCWEHLIFPQYIKPDHIREENSPDRRFAERLAMKYQENLSITAFMKFIVNRSCGCATIIKLPNYCTEEALEYVANECPILKVIDVGEGLSNLITHAIMPKFISKWKSLEMMTLGKFHMKEIVTQIGLHCNNFFALSAPYAHISEDEASAIVASVPKLEYLDLLRSGIEKEALVMILQGCKELVHLDVRDCWGFGDDDAEILELASHIPTFMCEGSVAGLVIFPQSVIDRQLYHEQVCIGMLDHCDCFDYLFDDDSTCGM